MGEIEWVGQHPLPPIRVKIILNLTTYCTTYLEGNIFPLIQQTVDYIDPRTQPLSSQAQDRVSIDAH